MLDALSRMPYQQCGRDSHSSPLPTSQISVTSLQVPQIPGVHCVREEQLADPTLGIIMLRGKEADQKPGLDGGCVSRATHRLLQIWDQLVVRDGVLCQHFEMANGSSAVIQVGIGHTLVQRYKR